MALRRHSMFAGAHDVAPILVGVAPFGLVAGALVVQSGFGLPESIGMSVFVFAGASQIVATSLFATGSLSVALLTALVVNSRMFVYSTSIAPVLTGAPDLLRPVLGYFLVDQNYAATMTQGRFREDVDVIWYYLGAGLALWIVWQISSLTGALVGPFIPASWGLDFAVPLVFLAMLAPTLTNKTSIGVAVVTGLAAAVFVPLLPFQSGLIAALAAGMLYGAWRDFTSPDQDPIPAEEEAAELAEAAAHGEDMP
jgi:4-azaleucine resistance transporter AzlC